MNFDNFQTPNALLSISMSEYFQYIQMHNMLVKSAEQYFGNTSVYKQPVSKKFWCLELTIYSLDLQNIDRQHDIWGAVKEKMLCILCILWYTMESEVIYTKFIKGRKMQHRWHITTINIFAFKRISPFLNFRTSGPSEEYSWILCWIVTVRLLCWQCTVLRGVNIKNARSARFHILY